MAEPQSQVPNLNEMMEEYTDGEEEVHLEPQTETTQVVEPEVQKEAQNPTQKEGKKKRAKKKVELSKLKNHKTTKLSFQMKLTPSGKRI